MDAQVKKGLLEYCVLAELLKKESYGYQIIRDLSVCIEISESTLYPILRWNRADTWILTMWNIITGSGNITASPTQAGNISNSSYPNRISCSRSSHLFQERM